jgi:hypothetical protein
VQLRAQRTHGFALERELILGVARALARLGGLSPARGRGQVERRAHRGSAGVRCGEEARRWEDVRGTR